MIFPATLIHCGFRAKSTGPLYNGISLTMPYLEPFLVKTMREAGEHLSNPELLRDICGFNARGKPLNATKDLMPFKRERLSGVCAYRGQARRSLQEAGQRNLRTKLAYSADLMHDQWLYHLDDQQKDTTV